MKAVVTGGAGFIGSYVTDYLIEQGHEALVIDDLSGGFIKNVNHKARFEQCDINGHCIEYLFHSFKPDLVYHLAAYAAEGLSHHIPRFNYENNLLGTVNILKNSYEVGVKHFVFTSSIAVYGHGTKRNFIESESLNPIDPYGISKLACEQHIKSMLSYYDGPNYTIFRPHNIIGNRQNISDPYRNVLGIFILKMLQDKAMPIFGDGQQTRSFSDVELVAKCITNSPFNKDAKNNIFNIGTDEQFTVLELANKVAKAFKKEPKIEWIKERKEAKNAHCDHYFAKQIFKEEYKNYRDIDTIISDMVQFYKKLETHALTECPSHIEIFDNLPENWAKRLKEQK